MGKPNPAIVGRGVSRSSRETDRLGRGREPPEATFTPPVAPARRHGGVCGVVNGRRHLRAARSRIREGRASRRAGRSSSGVGARKPDSANRRGGSPIGARKRSDRQARPGDRSLGRAETGYGEPSSRVTLTRQCTRLGGVRPVSKHGPRSLTDVRALGTANPSAERRRRREALEAAPPGGGHPADRPGVRALVPER